MSLSTEIVSLLKNIQDKYGYTLLEVSRKLGVTEAAVSRWNNGTAKPSRKNLFNLRELASGRESGEADIKKGVGVQANHEALDRLVHLLEQLDIQKLNDLVRDAPGRFLQLGEQIEMLRESHGAMKARFGTMEVKLAELEKKIYGRARDGREHDRTEKAPPSRK